MYFQLVFQFLKLVQQKLLATKQIASEMHVRREVKKELQSEYKYSKLLVIGYFKRIPQHVLYSFSLNNLENKKWNN